MPEELWWTLFGAVISVPVTLALEEPAKRWVARRKERFQRWQSDRALGFLHQGLVLVRVDADHLRLWNATPEAKWNVSVISKMSDRPSVSPYGDGGSWKLLAPVLRPGEFVDFRWDIITDQWSAIWPLGWRADRRGRTWLLRLADLVTRNKRDDWAWLKEEQVMPYNHAPQHMLAYDIESSFQFARKPFNPAVKEAVLALSDEEALKIMITRRTHNHPVPGYTFVEGRGLVPDA